MVSTPEHLANITVSHKATLEATKKLSEQLEGTLDRISGRHISVSDQGFDRYFAQTDLFSRAFAWIVARVVAGEEIRPDELDELRVALAEFELHCASVDKCLPNIVKLRGDMTVKSLDNIRGRNAEKALLDSIESLK